jgi:RNA polymerase sigma-70 factor (ECF subfamily)
MDPTDREVLAMRHYEQLSNVETAHILGINPSTASTRYVRALRRLRTELGELPGLFDPAPRAEPGR